MHDFFRMSFLGNLVKDRELGLGLRLGLGFLAIIISSTRVFLPRFPRQILCVDNRDISSITSDNSFIIITIFSLTGADISAS